MIDVDGIKMEMIAERERAGVVDVAEWLRRYPDLPGELLDFADEMNLIGRVGEIPPDDFWIDHDRVAENAMYDGLAAGLAAVGRDPDLLLGVVLARARRVSPPQSTVGSPTTPQFRRAAVFAWAVGALSRHGREPKRFVAQKTAYLLERGLELDLFTSWRRKAAGPYDPDLRYRDAEPIAVEKGWITPGSPFRAGPNMGDVDVYAPRYIGSWKAAERLVQRLTTLSDDELETWTTVDACAVDLMNARQRITADEVRREIAKVKDWVPKLTEPNFTHAAINEALRHLISLGLIPAELVDVPPR